MGHPAHFASREDPSMRATSTSASRTGRAKPVTRARRRAAWCAASGSGNGPTGVPSRGLRRWAKTHVGGRSEDQARPVPGDLGGSLGRVPVDDGGAPLVRSVEYAHCPQAVGICWASRRSIPAACASSVVSKSSGSASGSSAAASAGVASSRRSSTETTGLDRVCEPCRRPPPRAETL